MALFTQKFQFWYFPPISMPSSSQISILSTFALFREKKPRSAWKCVLSKQREWNEPLNIGSDIMKLQRKFLTMSSFTVIAPNIQSTTSNDDIDGVGKSIWSKRRVNKSLHLINSKSIRNQKNVLNSNEVFTPTIWMSNECISCYVIHSSMYWRPIVWNIFGMERHKTRRHGKKNRGKQNIHAY